MQPLFEKSEEFVRWTDVDVGECLPRFGTHQHAQAAAFERREGVFVGLVVAEIRGDGSFVAATPAESGVGLPDYATAAVIADVDQDGLPDALVAMNDGPLELLSGAADEPEGAGQGRGAWFSQIIMS